MKINSSLNRIAEFFLIISATWFLSACNSAMFDSSVDENGKKVAVDNQPATKVKKKKVKKVATPKVTTDAALETEDAETQAKSEEVAKVFSQELQAGQVKPYIPDPSDKVGNAGSTGTLLPTVKALEGKENNSPLAKITVQDVINGNVDLDKINNTENKDVVQTTTSVQENLPEPYIPNEVPPSPQDLQPIAKVGESIEVLNTNNENNVAALSSAAKCESDEAANASQVAFELATQQAARLKHEEGPIYIAPTIVSDSLSDCVTDVSGAINQSLKSNGLKTVVGSSVRVAQNSGSAAVIPPLIRACKQTGIPLLNVSVIRHIGQKTVITIRNIRVKDGITLVQNTTQL